MTLPTSDTLVLYPSGALTSESMIVHVESIEGGFAILLDQTACHPVDSTWPDQGPDRAVLNAGDVDVPVVDCVVAATDGKNLFLGEDVPVRKGTEGWTFVVAHIVDDDAGLSEGDSVTVEVDADYRAAISAGHTGCHLASLALNAALVEAWTKEAPLDAFGSPNFDSLAIESSRIVENGSLDVYRIGKSLRKKGFDPSILDGDDTTHSGVSLIADRANDLLVGWVAGGGRVRIDRDGDGLTDRRYWVCELPSVDGHKGEVRIPCGGTHVSSLLDIESIRVLLVPEPVDGGIGLVMTTKVR